MAPTVVVVGAGISGLGVAWEILERAQRAGGGVEVLCLEAAPRAGGNIRSERVDGFLCEAGPTGFLDSAPATVTLARRLGLSERMVQAHPRAVIRWIWRKGALRRVPLDAASFLRSGILSPRAKLRVLAEPFVRRSRIEDESVHDFAARRIGSEAAAVLVDAMVSGVFAGDARCLSLAATFPKMRAMEQEHGSLFRAMLRSRKKARTAGDTTGGPAGPGGVLTSFRDGLAEMTDALAAALGPRLRLGYPVQQVSSMGFRGIRVLPTQGPPIDCDALVLACPAWHAAPLVRALDAQLHGLLEAFPSAALAVVHTGFKTLALGEQPTGFGFLVPRGQGLRILGSLWMTQIFEGRGNDGSTLFTTMVGGAHDPAGAELPDDKLLSAVHADLQRVMGITVRPYFTRIVRWPRGIPQYTLGHPERLRTIEERIARYPGMFVSGSSYRGISINACVEETPRIAEAVLDHVTASRRDSASGTP